MEWVIDKGRPICPQIYEQVCLEIAKETFEPHEKLPSVRELALAIGVNPNTVQRSLDELERDGVLYSVRGSGWFVAEDIRAAKAIVHEMLEKKTADYFETMRMLGLDADAVKQYVKEWTV